jgi:hypothetical protein
MPLRNEGPDRGTPPRKKKIVRRSPDAREPTTKKEAAAVKPEMAKNV